MRGLIISKKETGMKYFQDQLTQPLQAGERGVEGKDFREKD